MVVGHKVWGGGHQNAELRDSETSTSPSKLQDEVFWWGGDKAVGHGGGTLLLDVGGGNVNALGGGGARTVVGAI